MNDDLEPHATAASEMAIDFSIKYNNVNNTGLSCDRMLEDAKKIHDFLIGESHHFKDEDFKLPFGKEDIKYMSNAMKNALYNNVSYGKIFFKVENGKPFFIGIRTDYNEDK